MGDDAGYLDPYVEATAKHGAVFEATLWASKQKQTDRFRVIAEMVNLRGRTILDAGAGLGDLAAWLHEHTIEIKKFIAVEGVARLAHEIGERDLPGVVALHDDFAGRDTFFHEMQRGHGPFDVIVFSGSLNTFEVERAREVLECAWLSLADAGRGTLVFNFLSSANDRGPAEPPAKRFDPIELLRWALDRTSIVRFRQDYFDGHDATIAMRVPE
ncbi:MAG: class I SAM-dependent methyltransferase [Planctomycetota bacterium]